MATISVNQISAYDATADKKITFNYSGNQCIGNKVTVYQNSNNNIVFSETVSSFALNHVIPANTLSNGVSYYLTITAYYKIGTSEYSIESSPSNVFYCLTTPVWEFTGVANNQIVANSSITLNMKYYQAQNEEVDEFLIVAYTASHTVFFQSDPLYDISESITITGLEDNGVYYLRAYGKTVNGLEFDTRTDYPNDLVINVDYTSPSVYSLVYLENIKDKGYVKVSTNVASIEGRTESGKEVIYINNAYADLTSDRVIFDENILIQSEFTLILRCHNIQINGLIIELNGTAPAMKVYWRYQEYFTYRKYFAELRCENYVLYTEPITVTDSKDEIVIKIDYRNKLYNINVNAGGSE